MSTPLWKLSASELAARIRRREHTSREVVETHLARIAEVDPVCRAIGAVHADPALAAADAADAAQGRGDAIGPLHGVPMTVKENVDVAGSATTQGVVVMKDAVPPLDAPHVAQLRAAGAIVIARTNLPDFGLRWHCESSLRGATQNPWDALRTPGGSSGGDAVALATGMTPLGNGNDYGGSLRIPAQFCGIASLRPTQGRVTHASSIAPAELSPTLQLFMVEGPMARRVADLRLALGCMSGRDPRDPWWTPAPLEGAGPRKPVRVAVSVDPGGAGVHPDVAAGVRCAADALADAGYAVEEREPPMVVEAAAMWSALVASDLRMQMLPLMRPLLSQASQRSLDFWLAREPEIDLATYQRKLADRNAIARAWTTFQTEFPLVLAPVCTQPPFPVGRDVESRQAAEEIFQSMRIVLVLNLLGLPAAVVPVGVAHGLPQGVQLIGDRYREDLCLAAAEAIESRVGVITPIEPVR
ncbi:MAG TPA: amidase [Myxococcota bacterium]|nr:amidase [Myxococcota bacterium]